MKIIFSLVVLIALLLITELVHAAVVVQHHPPVTRVRHNKNHQVLHYPATGFRAWMLKNYISVTGKKLTLKQKIALRIWEWKGRRLFQQGNEATPRQKKLGKMSLIFGAAAFVLAPIPIINILSFPAAIVAIVLGITSLRGNNNTNGVIGLVLGGVYILLLLLVLVFVLLLFGGLFN